MDLLKEHVYDQSFIKKLVQLEKQFESCSKWFRDNLQELEIKLNLASCDIHQKNMLLKDSERELTEKRNDESEDQAMSLKIEKQNPLITNL